MSLAGKLGHRFVVCTTCSRSGPVRRTSREARAAAKEEGWSRCYPRGRGEDFFCPQDRKPRGRPPR